MICSACDPSNESKLSAGFAIKDDSLTKAFVTGCATYFASFATYQTMITNLLNYAKTVAPSDKGVTDALSAISTQSTKQKGMLNGCLPGTTAPAAPAAPAKPAAKASSSGKNIGEFLPSLKSKAKTTAKKDDKKKPAAKKDAKKPAAKKSLVGEIQLGDGTGSLADPKKKKRRMQAAAPATPAAVQVSSNGVGVADVRTDLSSADSSFEGDGQGELASNLLKVFSSLAFALLVYFN